MFGPGAVEKLRARRDGIDIEGSGGGAEGGDARVPQPVDALPAASALTWAIDAFSHWRIVSLPPTPSQLTPDVVVVLPDTSTA